MSPHMPSGTGFPQAPERFDLDVASMYGIDVTGGEDATEALQAAFDDNPERRLLLRPGIYSCDEVTLSHAGTTLVGQGAILRRRTAGASNSAILRVLGDDIRIQQVRLESGGIGSRYLLRANVNAPTTAIKNLVLDRVVGVCDHRTARGIFVGFYDGLEIDKCYVENLLAEDDEPTDGLTAGIVLSAGDDQVSRDAFVTRTRVVGWYNGIESFGTGLRQGSLLDGNTVRLCTNIGILNYRGAQARVVKNHVEECFAGIYADSTAQGGETALGNVTEGNIVRKCATYGIVTEEHVGASVVGNTCTECQDGLILGGGTADSTITGNNCSRNSRYGIWADRAQTAVQDNLYDLLIANNICKLNGQDGIWVGGVKRTCTLNDNLCSDNGTSAAAAGNPYAGIRIGLSSDGATSGIVTVRGGALGNDINSSASTGAVGNQGNGVLVEAASTTLVRVHGVYFEGHDVANIDSGGVPLEEWGNTFADGVNDVAGTSQQPFKVGGQLLLADGAESAPAWSFTADPDTGARRAASNTMVLVSAGQDQAEISTTGLGVGQDSASPNSRLRVSSGITVAAETIKTTNYAVTNNDALIVSDGPSLTHTLPATPATSQRIAFRNQNGSSMTLARNGQTINGAASDLVVAASTAIVLSHITGSGWYVVG